MEKKVKILLTGDSIIARKEGLTEPHINHNLKQLLPNLQVINTAVSGINSVKFYAMLSELVLKRERCNKVAILLGTNDLAVNKQVPINQFKQKMALIASNLIHIYSPKDIIFISPPAVDELKQKYRTNYLVALYAAAIEEVTTDYHLQFINLYRAMITSKEPKVLCRGLLDDGLHFGNAGYTLLANLLFDQLTK